MIVIACFVVPSQRIVVGGLVFALMRIIIIVGMLRVLIRREYKGVTWHRLDLAVLIFILLRTFIAAVGDFPPAEFIQRLGGALDSLGMYFTCRCLIRQWPDVFTTVRGFIWIGIPVAFCFLLEAITHRNVFGAFGYVPEQGLMREGQYRAQAAFAHPILAGVYWAVLMPLMISLWWQSRKRRYEVILGLSVSTIIVVACHSSTPIMSMIFGLVAAALFPLRNSMRLIRWSLLVAFIAFQCLSDKPAWRLLVDVDIVGGSTGYYRYKLIDQAVKHVDEWGAMGGNIDTTNWSSELSDDTNHYVVVGLQGGLPLLTMFVIVIALAFGSVGRAWRHVRNDRPLVIAAWALGVSLFMHVMSFFSVTYFGQSVMLWDLTLAMIGSMRPTGKAAKLLSQGSAAHRARATAYSPGARVPVSAALLGH